MVQYLVLTVMAVTFLHCAENAAKTSNKTPQKNETMTVQHYKVPCQGESVQLCYLVKTQGQTDWEYCYDVIQGFEYEWGYVYTLEVNKTTIDNPPQDGSSIALKLVKVLKKEAVTERFELPLSMDGVALLEKDSGEWTYFQHIPVLVPEDLATKLDQAQTGVFQHGDKKQSLTLLSVK
ncbi:MAG: DUF4377 domain-containing protein [Haliscomenobacter sp.]|uniref:DUF4377 domain-containing protein n=1 Tax=Haliscomenobacter sp. TaxID=2717303 RepID=UPI0029ACD029|nr:DUF4377 domain-containing protein [Haliscomenobacter sp.]MDX2068563.1 DUF4377 domain-containing protein [Haliscomenobacter sp.]